MKPKSMKINHCHNPLPVVSFLVTVKASFDDVTVQHVRLENPHVSEMWFVSLFLYLIKLMGNFWLWRHIKSINYALTHRHHHCQRWKENDGQISITNWNLLLLTRLCDRFYLLLCAYWPHSFSAAKNKRVRYSIHYHCVFMFFSLFFLFVFNVFWANKCQKSSVFCSSLLESTLKWI